MTREEAVDVVSDMKLQRQEMIPICVHAKVTSDSPVRKTKPHSICHLPEWVERHEPLTNYDSQARSGEHLNSGILRTYRYIKIKGTSQGMHSQPSP
ncbi:hypothetical protein ADUPG1_010626 [Aduncisulcus paluster]|uniref:Uncharacterized protein n=1 Tax=Aduncisulcus paluster TaxID=2918883 RepID=A0ABQ5JS72_9EUKA|nr:hypothetical protein ADUPG1_010626 [Aduncisulcus paluster]